MDSTDSFRQQNPKIMPIKKPISPENALSRAAMLCSRCEQAEYDIRNKLKSWGITDSDIENIINRLISENYLNEERFAIAFTRDKFRFEGWGRIKIAYHLKCKHVTQHVIDAALSEIDKNEYIQSLEHILQVKMRSLKGKEPILAKASLLRFASSRGFEPNLIYRVLPKFVNCDDEY